MNLIILGASIKTIGEIIVGFMALSVHHRMKNRHKIDKEVVNAMQSEWYIGLAGVLLIVVGHFLEITQFFAV